MPFNTKYELSMYEEELQNAIEALENPGLLPASMGSFAEEIFNELKRIRDTFRNVIVRGYDGPHLVRYFQTHQHGAVRLINTANAHVEKHEVFSLIFAASVQVLDFIERECSNYFDLNAIVPHFYLQPTILNLTEDQKVISGKMKSKEVEPELQELILEYLSRFVASDEVRFRQLIYAKMISRHLLKVLSVNEKKDWTMKLIMELLYLNFNKVSFLKYCRHLMASQVEELRNVAEQKTKFHWFSKELESLEVKPNVGYRTEREGLREHLMAYVATELLFLSEWEKLHPDLAGAEFKLRAKQVAYKLPLSLSVPELAYIARLFIETGVFVVEKGQIMTVMKFFAENVTTRGTDQISAERIYKQSNPEAKTRDAVERVLSNMLSRLRNGGTTLSLGAGQ